MDRKITVEDILLYFQKNNAKTITYEPILKEIVKSPRDIFSCTRENISFISNKYLNKAKNLLRNTEASVVVVSKEIYEQINKDHLRTNIVIVENPKKEIILCLNWMFTKDEDNIEISKNCIIEKGAKIGNKVSIGAYSLISANSKIGDNVVIEENVIIKNAIIGDNCKIKSNTVIGNSGFGFSQNEQNEQIEFPHFGMVRIGKDVQIGSNTCIDRGALSDTIISNGVKIDNLVHVAHNVQIGKNSLIIANTLIGGSTIIGENCWLAPSVTLKNGIKIGNNTLIGMGAVVTKDFEDNLTIAGAPAVTISDLKKWIKIKKNLLAK